MLITRFLRAQIIFFAQIFRIVQDGYETLKSGVFCSYRHFGGTPHQGFFLRVIIVVFFLMGRATPGSNTGGSSDASELYKGTVRSKWKYPINRFALSGARIAGGSDWTVSSLNPLDAIEVAVTRRGPGLKDGDALFPEEAVKLETMLRAYTLEGAYSLFKENHIGSLEVGKLADIIILDRNLFQVPAYEIHNTSVVQTIFNGKVIYKKK